MRKNSQLKGTAGCIGENLVMLSELSWEILSFPCTVWLLQLASISSQPLAMTPKRRAFITLWMMGKPFSAFTRIWVILKSTLKCHHLVKQMSLLLLSLTNVNKTFLCQYYWIRNRKATCGGECLQSLHVRKERQGNIVRNTVSLSYMGNLSEPQL